MTRLLLLTAWLVCADPPAKIPQAPLPAEKSAKVAEKEKPTPTIILPPPPPVLPAGEIRAEHRDAFEKWMDTAVGCLKRHLDGVQLLDAPTLQRLQTDLAAANIDWRSFLLPGDKNLEFPDMLYQTEFREFPLYIANPAHLLRQITHRFPEASDVLPDGTIPNSSFFTNTCIPSFTPRRLCAEVASFQPRGLMTITKVKKNRTSEGIWVKDETGQKYICLFDSPFCPEMSSSAEFIGSTLARIIGYNLPKICITTVEGTGDKLYDGRRVVATVALKNFKDGWRYNCFRSRREVRALQLMGAWVSNVDQTEQNTGMTIDDAGVCRHYVIDFGAALGSFTFRPQLPRMGWTRLFDAYQQFTQPLYDHHLRPVPWEAPYRIHSAAVGYFTANFDPDRWQPFYRNMGFIEITEWDRVWIARRIAQVSDEQIRAVVGLAGYTHPSDTDYVATVLIQRRDVIVRRYLPGVKAPAAYPDADAEAVPAPTPTPHKE